MSMKLLFCMKNLSKFSKLPLIEIELNVKNLLKVLFFFFFCNESYSFWSRGEVKRGFSRELNRQRGFWGAPLLPSYYF